MIVDDKMLVEQSMKRFNESYENLKKYTGIVCASLQNKSDLSASIIFGSIQTISRRLNVLPTPDIIFADEAHMIPPKEQKSQYNKTFHVWKRNNPKLKIIAFTATPYRLNFGEIYGKRNRRDLTPHFPTLDYYKSLDELTAEGYLVPLKFMIAEKIDLSGIKKTGGDYNLKMLEEKMMEHLHVENALKAYLEYGENRQSCLIYCVSILHAEIICKKFQEAGISAECIHSKVDKGIRNDILESFKRSEIQVLTSVNCLIKGLDMPVASLCLLLRSTTSASLFCQMVGRLTRLSPETNKKDSLILDLSNNFLEFGNPSNPEIKIPNPPLERVSEEREKTGMSLKECPGCGVENQITAITCWKCQYIWQNNTPVRLVYVNWDLLKKTEAEGFIDKIYLTEHHSFVSSNKSLRVNVIIGNEEVSNFYSFQPKIIGMFRAFWRKATGNKIYPETIEEAIKRSDEININYVIIKKRDKYWKISSFLRK